MAKRQRYTRLTLAKTISILTAPVLIAFASQLLRPLLFPDRSPTDGFTILFLVSVVVVMAAWVAITISGAESDAIKQGDADEKLDQIVRSIDRLGAASKGTNVQLVGGVGSQEVTTSLLAQLQGAKSVRNTLVGFPRSETKAGATEVVYRQFFEAGEADGQWLDLASHNEIFGPRFTLDLDARKVGERHRVKALRHSVPLVNCTIIERPGGEHIVYFGWTYTATPVSGSVFSTENSDLSDLFISYFDHLWAQKTIGKPEESGWVAYNSKPPKLNGIDAVDKAGKWITIGMNGNEVESFAIVDINFDGGTSIIGQIYHPDLKQKNPIDAMNIDVSTSRLHFDYRINANERKPSGRCQYRFQKISGKDTLTGFFVNDNSKKWKDVYGIKVAAAHWHNGLETDVKMISQRKRELEDFAKKHRQSVLEVPDENSVGLS